MPDMPDGLSAPDNYIRGERVILLGLQWDLTVAATLQYLYDHNADGSQTATVITTLTGQGQVNDMWIPLPAGQYADSVPVTNIVQPATLEVISGTGRVVAWGISSPGTWSCHPNEDKYAGGALGVAPLNL